MEYQRPQWPQKRQITKKYANARKTKYPIFAGDEMQLSNFGKNCSEGLAKWTGCSC